MLQSSLNLSTVSLSDLTPSPSPAPGKPIESDFHSVVVCGTSYFWDINPDPTLQNGNTHCAIAWRRSGEIEFEAEGKSAEEAYLNLVEKIEQSLLSGSLRNPLNGSVIDVFDIDSLINAYEQLDAADKKIYAVKQAIREALAAKADKQENDSKTRRVIGKLRAAKLEFPSDSWDNSILKEAWLSYPAFRDEYLRIEKIAPKAREVKKLENTSGEPALMSFRAMLMNANRGPTGLPTVKIER